MRKKDATRLMLNDNIFGTGAQTVYEALCRANPNDKGVERFARRVGRAISAYEGGFVRANRPLGAFWLFGSPHAPLLEYAQVLAETWIGKRPDGNLSYRYIDCAGLQTARGTSNLAQLIGPPAVQANYPLVRLPLLAERSIVDTDFTVRSQAKYKALEDFQNEFIEKYKNLWQKIGGLHPLIHQRLQEEFQRVYQKGQPYRSVIVFDNLEYATPDLISEIIRPILHSATLQILGVNGIENVSFFTSIVIFIMHDRWNWLNIQESTLGFATSRNPQNGISADKYRACRQRLLETQHFSGLTGDIADNLILMGQRTHEQQRKRIEERLNEFAQKFGEREIFITWTPGFLTMLVEESLDPDLAFFTQRRTDGAFEKCVELPLAREIKQGALRQKSRISFEIKEEKEEKTISPVCVIHNGEGQPISPRQVTDLLAKTPSSLFAEPKKKNPSSFKFIGELENELEQIIAGIELSLMEKERLPPHMEESPPPE